MAWSAPITFVANAILTAAQMNSQVRDNMLETAPAKATTEGRLIVTTGANAVEERALPDDIVETAQTTTSATYTDLATVGPTVTLTTGVRALVFINAEIEINSTTEIGLASFAVSGATTSAAIDGRSVNYQSPVSGHQMRAATVNTIALTAGSNTFTMQYRTTGGTATFSRRRIQVLGL